MSSAGFPSSWSDPEYVATVVGVLATGAVVFYSAVAQSGPTVEEVTLVVLTITLPVGLAYEIARRWE